MPMTFKGPASRALDEWYRDGDVANNLREASTLLASDLSFADIIQTLSSRDRTKPAFRYPAGLAALQRLDFEPDARAAYLQAIGRAFGHNPPVPIRTTWEAGAGNTGFEFVFTDGVDHIEVTVRLPQGDIPPEDEEGLGLSAVERY
jgi:hypothetical protein